MERRRPDLPRRAHYLCRRGAVELVVGSGGQGLLLAPVFSPPARSQLRQPRRPRGDAGRHGLLARQGPRRLPLRRGTYLFERAGTNCEPAGDARVSQGGPRVDGRALRGPDPPRRGQPVADGRARTSGRATSSTWPSTSRSCRASSRRPPRRPPAYHRHLPAHARDPPACQWCLSSQPRRAHARDGEQTSAGTSTTPTARTRGCG